MSIESPPERYRRRRRWPILVVVVLLLAGAEVLWLHILKPPPAAASGCNQPGKPTVASTQTSRSTGVSPSAAATPRTATGATGASGASSSSSSSSTSSSTPSVTTLGTFTAVSALSGIRPADPATVDLTVLNASNAKGQAGTVTQDLRDVGFTSIAAAGNDPLYPASDLVCATEIRFGPAGLAQARTVLIVMPCAQLIMDGRLDSSVDLALGANFAFTPASAAMQQQLLQIHQEYIPPAVIEGQTASARTLGPIPPLPRVICGSNGPLVTGSVTPASRGTTGSSTLLGVSGASGASAASAASSGGSGLAGSAASAPQSSGLAGTSAAPQTGALTTEALSSGVGG